MRLHRRSEKITFHQKVRQWHRWVTGISIDLHYHLNRNVLAQIQTQEVNTTSRLMDQNCEPIIINAKNDWLRTRRKRLTYLLQSLYLPMKSRLRCKTQMAKVGPPRDCVSNLHMFTMFFPPYSDAINHSLGSLGGGHSPSSSAFLHYITNRSHPPFCRAKDSETVEKAGI